MTTSPIFPSITANFCDAHQNERQNHPEKEGKCTVSRRPDGTSPPSKCLMAFAFAPEASSRRLLGASRCRRGG